MKKTKDFRKTKDVVVGGSLALQSTEILKDRSISGLTKTASGFVGVGVVGAFANVAFDVAAPRKRKKRKGVK